MSMFITPSIAVPPEGAISADENGWFPISCAPEHDPILIWVPGINRGHASAEVVIMLRDDDGEMCWWTNGGPNGGSDLYFDKSPTHWMPLPSPPESE